MEEKINVEEILKDKSQGTKLYDLLYNIDVELDTISTTDTETVVWCTNETDNNTTCHRGYSEFGTVRGCSDGLQILLPSKEMRDWGKFAWKKGDVLVSKDNVHIIFEKFEDDTYTRFKGKHYLWEECNVEDYNKEETKMLTSVFEKASDDVAQTYIKTIEEHLDGKLNLETLEIEKSEFKNGDIAFAEYGNRQNVFIVSGKTDLSEGYNSFISLDLSGLTLNIGYRTSFFKKGFCKLRLATDSEKQQLFDALAKEGKAWDAEKKQIVDLPKKSEFKIFQKVLVRDYNGEEWIPGFFFRIHNDGCRYILVCGEIYKQCIPYNDHTEHLLGTTDEWKGGEG